MIDEKTLDLILIQELFKSNQSAFPLYGLMNQRMSKHIMPKTQQISTTFRIDSNSAIKKVEGPIFLL